jgi:hypothetical protein
MKERSAPQHSYRIFLLSPARVGGQRTDLLLSPKARFDLAHQIQTTGATLDEAFTFLSGLYFRGKSIYAKRFVRPYKKVPGIYVIISNHGLLPIDTIVTKEDLISFGEIPIDPADKRYVQNLQNAAEELLKKLPRNADVILLGSIGSKKYAELLIKIFGDRLKFPPDFVGRGDMSRGGLLLRRAESGEELEYVPIAGAVRHGKRPPKLEPRRWIFRS